MKTTFLFLYLSLGLDAGTTHYALERGAREAWLPTQNPWVIDTIIAGEAAAMHYSLDRLSKEHPGLAKALGWTVIGVRSAIVAHNIRQIRRLR